MKQRLFPLEAQYKERVWGGQRLKAADPPVGEAWIAFEKSRVSEGAHAGQMVGELAGLYGAQFLGKGAAARFGPRFSVLVKLLDCADWLSVQVHPDDEQARRLGRAGDSGKTEAWHFLEVEPGATIIAGVKAGTTREQLKAAIRGGNVLEVARQFEVHAGESYLLPAGTLHALGPGMLLYELQQASDTTYRVYDWDRPQSAGRKLHVEESVAVTDPSKGAVPTVPPALTGTSAVPVVRCPFFELDLVQVSGPPLKGDTQGLAFHVLTTTGGDAEVSCGEETARVGRHQTVLVAGGAGPYEVRALGEKATLLRATVPCEEPVEG